MPRGDRSDFVTTWGIAAGGGILAVVLAIIFWPQIGALIAPLEANRQQPQTQTAGSAPEQQSAANNAIYEAIRDFQRKQSGDADCGTPRECRAEQREKDDLVAQQRAAEAAMRQADAADWQTVIAFLGVVLLIATLIYTAQGTRAALKSVRAMQEMERGRLVPLIGGKMAYTNGEKTVITLKVRNTGRTTAFIRKVVFCKMPNARSLNLRQEQVEEMNQAIPADTSATAGTFELPTDNVRFPVVAGFVEYETIFGPEQHKCPFCIRLGDRRPGDGEIQCHPARLEP